MRKKMTQEVVVMVDFCNICKKEITHRQHASTAVKYRLPMINGLLKITTFDAHESCINKIIREAFKKYL